MTAKALIIVDVQNDFTEGGPFDPDGQGGNDAVAARIGSYTALRKDRYQVVATTQDWHIEPGDHFRKHAVHCVAGTVGADLDPQLDVGAGGGFADLVDWPLRKGLYADDYSAFNAIDGAGTRLPELLKAAGIDELDVCGFAADGCVAATVRDATAAGYVVTMLTDLSGVAQPDEWDNVVAELRGLGAHVQPSSHP